MINFCKKSFYALFNTASTTLAPPQEGSFAYHHRIPPLHVTACGAGLNFLTNSGEIQKPNNIIESSLLINNPVKSDQSETGLNVLSSGNVDRLASCTESLGFESCNERSINNDFDNSKKSTANGKSIKVNKKHKEVKNKSFPPPLSSLNSNGKPMFFLRPVRNNGRLKLIMVKIYRPESLRASRENGRLRLHLVQSDHKNDGVITSSNDVLGDELGDDDKDNKIVKEFEDCLWLEMAGQQTPAEAA